VAARGSNPLAATSARLGVEPWKTAETLGFPGFFQFRYPDFALVPRTNLVIGDPDADNLAIGA
jgi:hypothetical protein